MKKLGIMAAIAALSVSFVSCSSSKSACNGYFGVNNSKMKAQNQKEFKKSKHKSLKRSSSKGRH